MPPANYVTSVVRKHPVDTGSGCSTAGGERSCPGDPEVGGRVSAEHAVFPVLTSRGAISLGTDVDLFISLGDAPGGASIPMKDMYWSLFQFCADRGLKPRA